VNPLDSLSKNCLILKTFFGYFINNNYDLLNMKKGELEQIIIVS
jgi:hypothetical protein